MHGTLTTTPEGRTFALGRLKELRERHGWVTRHLADALDEIDDVAATYAAMALNAGIPAEEIAAFLGREPDPERVAARQREGVPRTRRRRRLRTTLRQIGQDRATVEAEPERARRMLEDMSVMSAQHGIEVEAIASAAGLPLSRVGDLLRAAEGDRR